MSILCLLRKQRAGTTQSIKYQPSPVVLLFFGRLIIIVLVVIILVIAHKHYRERDTRSAASILDAQQSAQPE